MTDGVVPLTTETLDAYFRAGVPTSHVMSHEPRCELLIDPRDESYEFLTPATGPLPDLAGMQRVTVDTVTTEDGADHRLVVQARDLRYEAYGVLVSVVQAMRGGATFAAATTAALTNLRAILSARRGLSPDQQVGLLGELLVARRLLDDAAEQDVLDWWLGPASEQHDLALPEGDVEVKTTTAERRVHVIHGLGQLRPNPGRPLWLVSIQVTRAGGGTQGTGLADLVRSVRARLTERRETFATYLHGAGWRDHDAELYRDRYLLRSDPQAYAVDDDFPAITDDRLRAAVPHHGLISAVSYRVDVSNWTAVPTGTALDGFLDDPRFAEGPTTDRIEENDV